MTQYKVTLVRGRRWEARGRIVVDVELHVDRDRSRYVRRIVSVDAAFDESQRARLAEICEKTPVRLLIKRGTRIDTTMQTYFD